MADTQKLDWRVEALAEYTAKRESLSAKKSGLTQQLQRIQKQLTDIDEQISDIDRAASVFGLLDRRATAEHVDDGTPPADGGAEGNDGVLVKDIALEALKQASPKPLRASDIKKIAEERLGKQLHQKTAGMTLYRMSQLGLVHSQGWDWFYGPKGGGQATA